MRLHECVPKEREREGESMTKNAINFGKYGRADIFFPRVSVFRKATKRENEEEKKKKVFSLWLALHACIAFFFDS